LPPTSGGTRRRTRESSGSSSRWTRTTRRGRSPT
jgi:hypothetical protein